MDRYEDIIELLKEVESNLAKLRDEYAKARRLICAALHAAPEPSCMFLNKEENEYEDNRCNTCTSSG